jgi:hypothetical protein
MGLKEPLRPAGSPAAESATSELKHPSVAVVIVALPLPPERSPKDAGDAVRLMPLGGGGFVGLKIISRTGCISIPFCATPVWPCRKSNMATPVICTGTLTCWKLELRVKAASNLERA